LLSQGCPSVFNGQKTKRLPPGIYLIGVIIHDFTRKLLLIVPLVTIAHSIAYNNRAASHHQELKYLESKHYPLGCTMIISKYYFRAVIARTFLNLSKLVKILEYIKHK
jgi:hypothetical protein